MDNHVVRFFITNIVAFVTLFVMLRLLGKRQLAELNFYDYVSGLTLGNVTADMITNQDSIVIYNVGTIIFWAIIAYGLSMLTNKNYTWKKILEGKPRVVVHQGKLQTETFLKQNFSIFDILEGLRAQGVFDITDVDTAVLEADGTISVLKKADKQPLTPSDMSVKTTQSGFYVPVVFRGKLLKSNLAPHGIKEKDVETALKKKNIQDLSQLYYAEMNPQKELYVIRSEQP